MDGDTGPTAPPDPGYTVPDYVDPDYVDPNAETPWTPPPPPGKYDPKFSGLTAVGWPGMIEHWWDKVCVTSGCTEESVD
jgi:hypothetical protein